MYHGLAQTKWDHFSPIFGCQEPVRDPWVISHKPSTSVGQTCHLQIDNQIGYMYASISKTGNDNQRMLYFVIIPSGYD